MQQLIFVFSGGTESERRLQIKGKDGNLSQVTLSPKLVIEPKTSLYSHSLSAIRIDLRWSAEFGPIAFYQHADPLDRKPGLYVSISVTC